MTDPDAGWQSVWNSWQAYLGDVGDCGRIGGPKDPDDVIAQLTPNTVAIVAAILTLAERISADTPVFLDTTP
jgi:hypothetical protein